MVSLLHPLWSFSAVIPPRKDEEHYLFYVRFTLGSVAECDVIKRMLKRNWLSFPIRNLGVSSVAGEELFPGWCKIEVDVTQDMRTLITWLWTRVRTSCTCYGWAQGPACFSTCLQQCDQICYAKKGIGRVLIGFTFSWRRHVDITDCGMARKHSSCGRWGSGATLWANPVSWFRVKRLELLSVKRTVS